MTLVHFLHIGKTGGSAVKHAIESVPVHARPQIRLHNHDITLMMVPVGQKVIFATRDPIERYVSSFFSRKREGKPRYDVAWTADEQAAFTRFATPNELAVGLSSAHEETQLAATKAMRSIGHVRSSYWDWFGDEAYLASRAPDIAFIARQEYLDQDFEELKQALGLPADLHLPNDDVAAHRNPKNVDRRLDQAAQRNLRAWYAKDYVFLDICRVMRMKILDAQRQASPTQITDVQAGGRGKLCGGFQS